MDTLALNRNAAKTALREALDQHQGNLKHEEVVEAISKLIALNPTANPAQSGSLLEGSWLLINAPNFPGSQQTQDGQFIYTLGRLAFNQFQPVDLWITINRVIQPVFSTDQGEKRTYNILVEFTTVDKNVPELRGIVRNLGVCFPDKPDTLQVQFTGAELAPLELENAEMMKHWIAVFGNQHQPGSLSVGDRFKSWIASVMFGLERSTELEPQTGKLSFKMKKSPKGTLQVLYLDEDLRITRGNRGTITICERR